ncbi:MAG: pseudaminic acid cytidylyltransferase [Lachnospiraceae bacterium]|nr:pseudaminic acid cytidylyltransferase [Lachnospiraceae bacterium]
MSMLAIITARGGSKRIPKKNIKEFLGKPIIAYSIETAINSGAFDEVMVSTDSEEIAEVARKYGASVPFFRSSETSNDFATTADVLAEVVEKYKEIGKEFDYIACIYPTAPFVTAKKLETAAKMLAESDADSLMPVVRFGFPPQRALAVRDGLLAFEKPEYALARSQDLEPLYHDCGQFYFLRTSSFAEQHALIMKKTIPYEMPEEEVQDIDNYSDWNMAELKYKMFIEENDGEQ